MRDDIGDLQSQLGKRCGKEGFEGLIEMWKSLYCTQAREVRVDAEFFTYKAARNVVSVDGKIDRQRTVLKQEKQVMMLGICSHKASKEAAEKALKKQATEIQQARKEQMRAEGTLKDVVSSCLQID